MACFVDRGAAFVVPLRGAAGHGARVDIAAVGGVEAWVRSRRDFGGEGASSENPAGEV